jgi:hypothetical protein
MIRSAHALAIAFVFIIAAGLPARAQSFLGPKTYVLGSGPASFTETFSVDSVARCDGRGTFTLVVENRGIASARITLNGVPVMLEHDFSIGRTGFEVPMIPIGNNVLTTELKGGQNGGSLVVAIRRDIQEPLVPAETFSLSGGRDVFRRLITTPDPGGHYVLMIRNGDAGGQHRVASGTITIGADTVIDQKELHSTAGEIRKIVSLGVQNEMVLDLRGNRGAILTASVKKIRDQSACGPKIVFTQPANHADVTSATIAVAGTVSGPADVGVTVNGLAAELDLFHAGTEADPYRWYADVSAPPGHVALTATATTAAGATATAERTVLFLPDPKSVLVDVSPRVGIAPHQVTVSIAHPAPDAVTRYRIDFNGDGVPEVDSPDLPETVSFTYQTAGRHRIAVHCLHSDGTSTSTAAYVLVQPFSAVDAVLRASWTRFSEAAGRQDIESALQELSPPARQKYEPALRATRTALPAYVASITGFNAVTVYEKAAHYLLRRTSDGRTKGYHVYFTRGADGVWRIDQF